MVTVMQVTHFILVLTYLISFGQCKMEPFVVNGETGQIVNFSYSALLDFRCVYEDLTEDIYICGSSIVNQLLTLTAGHCLFQCTEKSKINVYVGHEGMFSGNSVEIHSFVHHDDYDPLTISNDIGLIKLKVPLELNSKIGRVALMPDPPYNEEGIIAGWGMHDEVFDDFPYILQYTTQTVMNKEDCQKVMQNNLLAGTFCAVGKEGYPSRGDSGSALVVQEYIQIGIVSFKNMNTSGEYQNVVIYTDTGYFYKWIDENAHFVACET